MKLITNRDICIIKNEKLAWNISNSILKLQSLYTYHYIFFIFSLFSPMSR